MVSKVLIRLHQEMPLCSQVEEGLLVAADTKLMHPYHRDCVTRCHQTLI